jgi:hypothetical protein
MGAQSAVRAGCMPGRWARSAKLGSWEIGGDGGTGGAFILGLAHKCGAYLRSACRAATPSIEFRGCASAALVRDSAQDSRLHVITVALAMPVPCWRERIR